MVESGELEIQGGVYHLATGRVEFLGRSPMPLGGTTWCCTLEKLTPKPRLRRFQTRGLRQAELLACKSSLPPSMASLPIRTTGNAVVKPDEAMQLLKEGNKRFTSGTAVSGKITPSMRRDSRVGQCWVVTNEVIQVSFR